MIKIQNIPVTLRTFLYQLNHFREKLYTKGDISKTTTSEVLSETTMRKEISKQSLTFVGSIDLDTMSLLLSLLAP